MKTRELKKHSQNVIAELKKASDERFSALKRMVEEMLARQGMTFRDVEAGKTVEVDETTRAEAQALLQRVENLVLKQLVTEL